VTTASETPALTRDRRSRLALVLAAFALLLAPLGLLADKAVVPLALAAAVAGGLVFGRAAPPWRLIDRSVAAALGAFLAWCLVTSTWSPEPLEAAKLALRIAVMLFALLYLAGLAQRLDERGRGLVARAFCIGLAVSAAVIVLDLVLDGAIFNLLQGTARSDYAADSRLNRGVSALAVLVWPLAALAWQRGHRWAALALPPAAFALVIFSQSSASMLALALGLVAAMISALGRVAARLVMAMAMVGALFATPLALEPMQQSITALDLPVPDTGLYRLHIWRVVSDRIAERPLLGWGFDASPNLPAGDAKPFRPDKNIIPSHPHNGGLQIMVELGIIGSLLALGVLLLVAQRLDRLPRAERAAGIAMTVTIMVVACTAYSIWQSHWLAMIGGAAGIFVALRAPSGES